ncbi:MAG TPA: hypothetical protein VGC42_09115 [Kofleriaceae bacterium]
MRLAFIALAGSAGLATLAGCPHGDTPRPSGPEPTVADVVEHLTKARDALRSFKGEAVMEYWLGNDRFKGDVLAMGEVGARVRIAALSPAGGSTIAEMVCDGAQFTSINYQQNCVLTGPCNEQSIATFFGIELAPDDFLHLALGTPPVVDQPRGSVAWDAGQGLRKIELEGTGGKQTLRIDDRDQKWDVIETERTGAGGVPLWTVKNGSFQDATDATGAKHRVPGKSHFTTPNHQKADLTVEWSKQQVNIPLDPAAFKLAVPPGLLACGPAPKK